MKYTQYIIRTLLAVLLTGLLFACNSDNKTESDSPPDTTSQTAAFTLGWSPPDHDEGDEVLTGLSGYNVYYGTSPRTGNDPKECTLCGYSEKIDVGDVTTHTIVLERGTYYFAVTAYDDAGNESSFTSFEISSTK